MTPIKCPQCGTLFGIEVDGVLNIKHRDLYRYVRGEVWGACRKCGTEVRWSERGNDSRS